MDSGAGVQPRRALVLVLGVDFNREIGVYVAMVRIASGPCRLYGLRDASPVIGTKRTGIVFCSTIPSLVLVTMTSS